MKLTFKSKISRSFVVGLLLVFLSVLLATRTLWRAELFRSHDLEFHAARVANFYLAFKQGQIIPRWAPNLNYGFGHPSFLFTYFLPYLGAAFFYALGLPIEASINALIITAFFCAGMGMYLFAWSQTKDWSVSYVAALLYQAAPYTLLNVFVRGALGEIVFFGALPWVFLVLSQWRNATRWYGIVTPVILTLWLLSHPLSLMIGLPLICLWWLICCWWPEEKHFDRETIVFCGYVLASLMMACFFWLPMIFEQHWTNLAVNFSINRYYEQFPGLKNLIWSNWEYSNFSGSNPQEKYTRMVGIGSLLVIALSLISSIKNKGKRPYRDLLFWLITFFISIFLMLPLSRPVWETVGLLKNLQFPWRLLWIAVTSSVLLLITLAKQKKTFYFQISLTLIAITSLLQLIFFAHPFSYFKSPDQEWVLYPKTADSYDELKPRTFDSNKNLKLTEKVIVRLDGTKVFPNLALKEPLNGGDVLIQEWNGSSMEYQVTATRSARVIQKTAFFPGWEVWVDNQKVAIESTDEEFPGRLIFPISAGTHQVKVLWTNNTKIRRIGDRVALGGMVLVILTMGFSLFQTVNLKNNSQLSSSDKKEIKHTIEHKIKQRAQKKYLPKK